MNNEILRGEKGYALLVIFLILSVMGLLLMGLSIIVATKIKSSIASSDSMVSFYAAESGTEKFLYETRKNGYSPAVGGNFSGSLSNSASYSATVTVVGIATTTVKSIGSFNNVSRALELDFGN